jgi:hypothetical protein
MGRGNQLGGTGGAVLGATGGATGGLTTIVRV